MASEGRPAVPLEFGSFSKMGRRWKAQCLMAVVVFTVSGRVVAIPLVPYRCGIASVHDTRAYGGDRFRLPKAAKIPHQKCPACSNDVHVTMTGKIGDVTFAGVQGT